MSQTIFYDRDCGFCRYLVARILQWDQAADQILRPQAIQDADAALAGVVAAERLASWHLQQADGSIVSAGAALPVVLDLVNRHRLLAAAFRHYPQLTERGYRWVVAHRSTLGRLTQRWAKFRGTSYPPVITDGNGITTTSTAP